MRKLLLIAALLVLFSASLFAGMLVNALYYTPKTDSGRKVSLLVDRGEPFSNIAGKLDSLGLIRHPRILILYSILRHSDRHMRAGTYEFTIGERPIEIMENILKGNVLQKAVTIPEGYGVCQIAGLLSAAVGVDSAEFSSFALSKEASERFNLDVPNLEGYLFPETYLIPWGAGVEYIASMMISKLQAVLNDSLIDRASHIKMSAHEILTLASIIEAETHLARERPLVSSVYHNRLRLGMKLEADPTVAYALGGHRILSKRDLRFESPYNTYLYAGLPPGPICNPGKASILAALYPDSTSRALYFVAGGDGGHIFSLTLREHLAAVARVKSMRKSRKKLIY